MLVQSRRNKVFKLTKVRLPIGILLDLSASRGSELDVVMVLLLLVLSALRLVNQLDSDLVTRVLDAFGRCPGLAYFECQMLLRYDFALE